MDRHLGLGPVGEDLNEPSSPEVIKSQIAGNIDEPSAFEGCRPLGFVVVDLQTAVDLDRERLPSCIAEGPAVAGLKVEVQDTRHAGQIAWRGWDAMLLQERRRGAAGKAVGPHPPRNKAAGTELAHAHCKVEAFADKVHLAIGERELNGELRPLGGQTREDACKPTRP